METVKVIIPTPFRPLLRENRRYKFYYGGRAGGKSFAFADSLLMRAREKRFLSPVFVKFRILSRILSISFYATGLIIMV